MQTIKENKRRTVHSLNEFANYILQAISLKQSHVNSEDYVHVTGECENHTSDKGTTDNIYHFVFSFRARVNFRSHEHEEIIFEDNAQISYGDTFNIEEYIRNRLSQTVLTMTSQNPDFRGNITGRYNPASHSLNLKSKLAIPRTHTK